MAGQFVLELVAAARLQEQVHVVVTAYGERLTVGREGVICDGMVKEMIYFWTGHDDFSVQ